MSTTEKIAYCVVCGCSDVQDCAGGCSWVWVDYANHEGVCTQCRKKKVKKAS